MSRRRRHINRNLFLLFFGAIVAVTLYRNGLPPQIKITPPEPEPLGLNHFINNELSDLDEMTQMERSIERFIQQWKVVGASVAVMKEGRLVYSKGFGYADRENQIPVDAFHVFRIASLSKLITATAVMKLYEEGKLKLEDKVFGEEGILNDSIFLDIRDRQVRNITVEHLLRHRAGYSLRAGDPLFNHRMVTYTLGCSAPLTMDDLVHYAAASRLQYRPGSSNIYSNLGYTVLSKVIEKISGMPYETYVREKIMASIGCFDMHIGKSPPEGRRFNEVVYYEQEDAEWVAAYDGSDKEVPRRYGGCDLEVLSGAGGWVASPTELLRFISAIDPADNFYNLLKPETIRTMTAFTDDEYPIGWMKTTKNDDWSRSGSLAGTSAMLKRQNNGYTWILITNTSSWNGSRFPNTIAKMMTESMQKVKTWPDRDLFIMAQEKAESQFDSNDKSEKNDDNLL